MPVQSPRHSVEEAVNLLPAESTPCTLSPPSKNTKKPWFLIVGLIILLFAVIDVGVGLADAPKTRIFETNICLRYYQQNDPTAIDPHDTVPETECKIDAIQQELAMIFGWQETFDAIPGILLAVPFGALADIWGRKRILTLALVGLQLSTAWVLFICYFQRLPLQWTWLSSAFSLIGGGSVVAVAAGMTMISDVTPPEKRTNVFLYTTAAMLLSETIAPILASRLMGKSSWIPLLLAYAIQQLGVTIAMFCPETIHMQDQFDSRAIESERAMETSKEEQIYSFKAQLSYFKAAFIFLKSDSTLMLVVLSYLGNKSGRQAIQLLVRYASKRYDWEIKKAALLPSFRAATNLLSVAVLIPGFNYILLEYLRVPLQWADVWLARGSIIALASSFVIMGLASKPALLIIGLLVYNLGIGYASAIRSIAINAIGGPSSPHVSKLMSLLAITESIGLMVSGPLINGLFKWGMDIGSAGLGLPFLGIGLVYGLLTVVTFIISVKDQDLEYVEIISENDEEVQYTEQSELTPDAELIQRHNS
jgi:MFS family permease